MHLSKLLKTTLLPLFLLLASTSFAQNESFVMTPIGPNNLLNKPLDLHYGPDDHLWITERITGILLRVNPLTAERDELIQISEISSTGGQDGLLGFALSPGLLSNDPYVYVSYTYLVQEERKQKLVRYTYELNGTDGSLSSPVTLIDNLPASNDHNSGKLIFGPAEKLYYTIGDQGSNQWSNACNPILSQVLPTQAEVDQQDWTNYPGKILRLNTDGSIPSDNPMLAGVQSHIYSYGHRNAQGIAFGSNGLLYADEHGPSTDDEVNIIYAGNNYGWPNVAGYQDDQAYDYCNWESIIDCESLEFSPNGCPAAATFLAESSFSAPNYQEPLLSMFAVTDDYDFNNSNCNNAWICRPNVAPSSLGFYGSDAIPAWKNSLLVVSLKRGRIYRLKLDEAGTAITGDTIQHFYTTNRYRDIVTAPDGKSFYIITDDGGNTSDASGFNIVNSLDNPGAILKFSLEESVSATELDTAPQFKLWPNPVSDQLNIELTVTHERVLGAALISSTGKVVRTFEELQTGVNELDVAGFSAGVYTLRLYSESHSWYEQIVLY